MQTAARFAGLYPDTDPSAVRTVFSPYRVCPLGAHIDHQWGVVTGFALDIGVTLAFAVRSDALVLVDSMDFPGKVCFDLRDFPEKQGNWGDYARGAVSALKSKGYNPLKGFQGVIEGPVSVGGLSSSAAVVLCYVKALAAANNFRLSDRDLIDIAQLAENGYIGLKNGKLDQSCEVLCRKNTLLVLDAKDDSYEQIPSPPDMPPWEVMVVCSGVSRTLGKGYNMRVDEAKSASYCLKAFAGLPYGTYKDSRLRDVDPAVYEKYKDRLPENFRRRAAHYYSEMERVQTGVEAWKKGDLHAFGQQIFASGESSIANWETGSPELIAITRLMEQTDGVYGGRFSGAGFKGCCMGIVDPAKEKEITKKITEGYLSQFPRYRNSFRIFFCRTSDGVGSRRD